jgi:hypothetical protein
MSEIRGSAHSKYAGLLPIEPPEDFFRPIDLVPFPNRRPPVRKRPRILARFPIAFCTGVAATWLWQSYGDTARETVASSYRQLGWFAPRHAPTAQNRRPPDVIALAAPAAPSSDQPNAMSSDLDAVGQNDKITPTPATATSIDQASAAKASGVTVESDAASLEPAVRLNMRPTKPKPPEISSEKEKPLSAMSEHDTSCFVSASAVLQNHLGGWPTWTLKAPGHEGTMCWYAAARPRGSDHRSERVARKEMVGTTENGLSAPFAPRGRAGPWDGGLP